jgi:class 3 adenylate cyclase
MASDLAVKEFAQPEAGRDPGVANLPRRNVAALEQVERRAEFGVDFLGNGFRAPQELVALVVRRGVAGLVRAELKDCGVSTSSTVEVSGERRHVTAMFCDLVDLTGIAAKLDAEEWRGLVGAYLRRFHRSHRMGW